MFGLFKKKTTTVHPAVLQQWAESLGHLTFDFRTRFVGASSDDARRQVEASWAGCEIADVDPLAFSLRNRRILEPFKFIFKSRSLDDRTIEIILVGADAPLSNVLIACDERTTNYLVRCAERDLNGSERAFCEALSKFGRIPKGRLEQPIVEKPLNAVPDRVPGGDSRPMVGVLVLGMAHLIRGRGEGAEAIERIIGPLWDIVRQHTASEEKAVEVVKFNLDQAFTMPVEAIPRVVEELAKEMSPRAREEVGVTLIWYSQFTDRVAGVVSAERDPRPKLIEIYLDAMAVAESDRPMLYRQAAQRLEGSPDSVRS
jgi:hypothetical protein